jgi:eukaryotic-like serine/threonine-protein kinase
MRFRPSPQVPLLRLPRLVERDAQAASFREALAALAQTSEVMGPPPLDGVDPRALETAAFIAVERGLADDLDFLESGAAAVALFELASALPSGTVKRELRRRVFSLLYEGNAATFVPIATRIALGNPSPLSTPTLRARVSLCVELPIGTAINPAPLAFALATRAETHLTWIAEPSRRGLAARRTAALLYEHAAREAVFRFQQGDSQALRKLCDPALQVSFRRLLWDREPLVWRSAAIARGLLAAMDREVQDEVEKELDPALGITEWRRAAVSLTSSLCLGDLGSTRALIALSRGPLAQADPGLVPTVAVALPRLAEFDVERSKEIVERFSRDKRADFALSLGQALEQTREREFVERARPGLLEALRASNAHPLFRDGYGRIRAENALTRSSDGQVLQSSVQFALETYESEGARPAFECAMTALELAQACAESLDLSAEDKAPSRLSLIELDASAFERSTLYDLLLLKRRPGDADTLVEPMERLRGAVLGQVVAAVRASEEANWSDELRLNEQVLLRALLHIVDADGTILSEKDKLGPSPLEHSVKVLIERLIRGPDPVSQRVLCAALARCLDAMVRSEAAHPSDLLLVVFASVPDAFFLRTLAEASTTPAIAEPFAALAAFVNPDTASESAMESNLRSDLSGLSDPADSRALKAATKLLALSQGILGGGYHAEAVRRAIFRMARSLESIATTSSHAELVEPRDGGEKPLEELVRSVDDFTQMLKNALLLVLGQAPRHASTGYDSLDLHQVLQRGLDRGEPPSHDDIACAIEALVRELPEPLARNIEEVTFRVHGLPALAEAQNVVPLLPRRAALPDWLLPRRTIGSFYVLRSLGSGGNSSVFFARRIEERNNTAGECFALKVPDYDPQTARSMSEQEFLQLFKEEAGALLSLPQHPNLARFVTFDLAARPKPILVMELIRGIPLERLLRSRKLTIARVASYADSLLAALEVMHGVGIGHLDIKPSNLILRDGTEPVLVDFGLSGRKLRLGCGTAQYSAPEILGVSPEGHEPRPEPADIYAVGALVYELLTGTLLFDAQDEYAIVAQHVSHDGWLDKLERMDQFPELSDLARTLGSCLRQDPRNRPTAGALRESLARALAPLKAITWPLDLPAGFEGQARAEAAKA